MLLCKHMVHPMCVSHCSGAFRRWNENQRSKQISTLRAAVVKPRQRFGSTGESSHLQFRARAKRLGNDARKEVAVNLKGVQESEVFSSEGEQWMQGKDA